MLLATLLRHKLESAGRENLLLNLFDESETPFQELAIVTCRPAELLS
jgi:hypothetical protein